MRTDRIGILVAVVMAFGYQFVLHYYRWVQEYWGAEFRTSGNLRGWWVISALAVAALLVVFIGVMYVVLMRWMKIGRKSLVVSTCIDLSCCVVLWFLGALMGDPLTKPQLAANGLGYSSDILLSLGTIWVIVTIFRLGLMGGWRTLSPSNVE